MLICLRLPEKNFYFPHLCEEIAAMKLPLQKSMSCLLPARPLRIYHKSTLLAGSNKEVVMKYYHINKYVLYKMVQPVLLKIVCKGTSMLNNIEVLMIGRKEGAKVFFRPGIQRRISPFITYNTVNSVLLPFSSYPWNNVYPINVE